MAQNEAHWHIANKICQHAPFHETLNIHSIASQLGENIASTKGEIKGEGSITLNSRYLLDALHVMTGEDIVFSVNGKLEPSMLSNPKDKDYIHVIMPLKS